MDTGDTRVPTGTVEYRGRAPLPFERAFVVQLRADADVVAGAVSGRAEHLSSGAAAVFDSVEELIAWMAEAIARDSTRARK
jgi:hypothetical protein